MNPFFAITETHETLGFFLSLFERKLQMPIEAKEGEIEEGNKISRLIKGGEAYNESDSKVYSRRENRRVDFRLHTWTGRPIHRVLTLRSVASDGEG